MNTRMEQADSTRMHKATQHWLGKGVASRPYLEVLPWILLRLGQEMPAENSARAKLALHKVLPDLPGYVDPLKDGEAALQNITGCLGTLEEECSKRGKDWQAIANQRVKEKEYFKSIGLDEPQPPGAVAPDTAQPTPAKPKSKAKEATGND